MLFWILPNGRRLLPSGQHASVFFVAPAGVAKRMPGAQRYSLVLRVRCPSIEKPSVQRNKSAKEVLGLGDKTVAHFAHGFDLGLHHVANFKKRIGALTDAAACAAAENIPGLERAHGRGILALLFGREYDLRGV